jgi:hypothetical protein
MVVWVVTSMSIVSSNSVLMISIRVFFEMYPSFVGCPPSATNASTAHIKTI